MPHRELKNFTKANDVYFHDLKLLRTALTHSTYAYENQQSADNERLEFLGDAVLQLAVTEYLFHLKPAIQEGEMTKIRALVVCENTLARVAEDLHIGEFLRLGKGEEMTGGRSKPSNLSNAVEALLGAHYIDQGGEKTREVIYRWLKPYLTQAIQGKMVYDFKSQLLELVQSTRGSSTMRFEIINEQGPVHNRLFTAAVLVDDRQITIGTGRSKKDAEQSAAREALKILTCDDGGCFVEETKQENANN